MKIENNQNIVESSGFVETASFSIKTTAAAFQLLSSGLYSNKIRAVVRELSCNAVDAHTMVGKKDIPIEVKLPNNLDTRFYVKDQGPGLSHENVMRMYTTYFDSTKQTSNEMIGGFGVGSKSPFAYTDSFSVESRFEGKRRVYTAFIDENGAPQIALLSESDMDPGEYTGLTVSIPIKPNDFNSFIDEAHDLLRWFDTMPQVIGSTKNIRENILEKLSEGLYSRKTILGGDSFYMIRMGNLVYKIDKHIDQLEGVSEKLHSLRMFKLLFDVPIGAISIAASREDIALDKKTKEYLTLMIHKGYKEAMKKVVDKLDTFDGNTLNGRKEALEFLYSLNFRELRSKKEVNELTIHNRKIPPLNVLLNEYGINPDKYLNLFKVLDGVEKNISSHLIAVTPCRSNKLESWFSMAALNSQRCNLNVGHNEKLMFLDVDMPLGNIYAEQARKKLLRCPEKIIALRKPNNVSQSDYEEAITKQMKIWGVKDIPIIKLSNMLSPEDLAKFDKTKIDTTVSITSFFTKRISICTNETKGFIYVPLNASGDPVAPTNVKHFEWAQLIELLRKKNSVTKNVLKDLGVDSAISSRIYFVDKDNVEKIKKLNGATLLDDILQNVNTKEFLIKWSALLPLKENKEHPYFSVINNALKKCSDPNVSHAYTQTQMGKLEQWLNSLQMWKTDDEKNVLEDEIYREIIETTAKALGYTIQPKMIYNNDLKVLIKKCYPLVASFITEHQWRIKEDELRDIIDYITWRDATTQNILLPGVTTPVSLQNTTLDLSTTL